MLRLVLPACLAATCAFAEAPVVESATAQRTEGSWQFTVTLSHPDTGWDHYADAWRVLDMAGNELGIRVLLHPHETEQPFTRSLGGVAIPTGTEAVQIQSRCLVDGWSDRLYRLDLP